METAQQELTCQLCSEQYADPRILPCLHSFCRQCLDKEARDTAPMVACPACAWCGPIPAGGAGFLPRNLHLVYEVRMSQAASQITCERCAFSEPAAVFCFKCSEFLCGACAEQHPPVHKPVPLGGGRGCARQIVAAVLAMPPLEHCCALSNHADRVLELFCEACDAMICRECATAGDHRDHRHANLADVARARRRDMRRALEQAQEMVAVLGGALDRADSAARTLEDFKACNAAQISNAFEELHEKVEARKRSLLADLDAATSRRASALDYRRTRIREAQRDLYRYCEVVFRALQTHSDQEVVAMENAPLAALSDTLRASKNVASIDPGRSQAEGLSVLLETDRLALDSLGRVKDTSPYPPACTWASTTVAMVKSPYRVVVDTVTVTGEKCRGGGVYVTVDLASKVHDRLVASGNVEDRGDGTYTVTLVPHRDGAHVLSVLIDGQHVMNSPFELDVQKPPKPDYCALNPPQEVASVKSPLCLAVSRSGDVFVGTKSNSIHVFDRKGGFKRAIGSSGEGDGQFNGPSDLAISGDLLYVADCLNHRVQMLTTGGEFLQTFGERGTGSGQFNAPCGLAVDARGRIYVCDSGNDRVQVFGDDRTWLMSVDVRGQAMQHSPRGLALDTQGNMYVAAHGSACIMVFTRGGKFLKNYGNLKRPGRIAVNSGGYSFVIEGGSDSIVVFDPQGRRVYTLKGLNSPSGIAVDPAASPSFYVANKGSNTVLKYSL
eukprot:Em0005g527a